MQSTGVDKCADNNGGCSQLATCTNVPGSVYCTCNAGYTGDGFTCSGKTFISSAALQKCQKTNLIDDRGQTGHVTTHALDSAAAGCLGHSRTPRRASSQLMDVTVETYCYRTTL